MENILVIEDEVKVSLVIKAYLEREGFKIYCTTSGLEGIRLFESINFKLVILDLMLPDIGGEEVCKLLRRKSDVYIFMLTAKGTLEDKISGLNLGADEYLIKPCSPRELTARVKSLYRRLCNEEKPQFIYSDSYLSVSAEGRIVLVEGKEVPFTPNEFDILIALIKNKYKTLSREQLIQLAFELDFEGSDRTIDVHIKNIRKKLERDSKNPRYIITVIKIGYKFGGGS